MGKYNDLTGQKFGKLIVKEFVKQEGQYTYWLCDCECDNTKIAKGKQLVSGDTKSCGCLRIEHIKSVEKNTGANHHSRNLIHGNKLIHVWNTMKHRCYNLNYKGYKYYGEKGITVCDEWLNEETGFINFYNWAIDNNYKEGLSIDRINNEEGYSPNNCEWVTHFEQCNNKSTNILITINDRTQTATEWSRECEVSADLIRNRYLEGIQGEDLLKPLEKPFAQMEITSDGITKTVEEWAEEIGYKNYRTIYTRYYRGLRGAELIKKIHESKL